MDLVAANGLVIQTYGKRKMLVSFAPGHRVAHNFWIATVGRPILGADFFSEHHILIDLAGKKLLTNTSE